VLDADLVAVAYRAMWGYGVDRSADFNPHLVSCHARQPDPGRELKLADHHHALGRVAAFAGPGGSWRTLPCQRLNRPVQRRLEQAPCDTGYAIRTAQVTGLFDLSPSSVPSREVRERSTAGTSQVSKRPAETGAATANRNRFIDGRSSHSAAKAGPR